MRKTLTTIVVLLLSIACAVVIVIGISGTSKKSKSLEIATPISSRIINPSASSSQASQSVQYAALEGPSQRLANAAAGTITWLPKPGDLIEFGTALYAVDHKPIILMEGSLPMYRDIAYKVSDGPDVAQLERNLVNLGYVADEATTGNSSDLTVDHHVTPLTESSIRSWQLSLGLTSTGVVKQGDVVFRPEAVQISELHVALGEVIEAGSVLSVLLNPEE
ncbi:MAG: peptidoglycan-binding domain-containing protein [Acidimicrobiales bacterium]|nr:peptidoglycan-binding domain-containing protein [Actinomycetota bacterium]MEC9089343.1 peptidoglycan-binding domain-containing protein [Actinomycetota bacterium]